MQTILLLALAGGALLLLAAVTHFSGQGSLNNIKSKTVGDGQHGTARWATKKEIQQTYAHVPFRPEEWRKGERLPKKQGLWGDVLHRFLRNRMAVFGAIVMILLILCALLLTACSA